MQWLNPGFPIVGVNLVGEGIDSRGSYVSKILPVETKESGPLGTRPPRSANDMVQKGE